METFNVSDFENFIRSYMSNQIKLKYPEIDTSLNSSFDDLYIKPNAQIFAPIINLVNNIELMSSLENPGDISEEDMDKIGVNNYGIERSTGSKATTTETFSFNRISEGTDTIIPEGVVVETLDGLQFKTTAKKSYTPAEMVAHYNPSTLTYDIDVDIEAFYTGKEYNVPEHQITLCTTKFNNFLTSVTNKKEVKNGVDKESNIDYADRLKKYYTTRYLGTRPGYEARIKEVSPEVQDVKVIGKDDPEMVRDKVTVKVNESETKEINIGGKVDIYIRGSNSTNLTAPIKFLSGKLRLSTLYENIDISTVTCVNLEDSSKTVVFITQNEKNDCFLLIDNTGEQSYNPRVINTIRVSYTNKLTNTPVSDEFSVGATEVALETPFRNIISVVNSDDSSVAYNSSYYDIVRTSIFGDSVDEASPYYLSTQEMATVRFKNMDEIENGTTAEITYAVNETLADLRSHFEEENNRVITTDLLIKEAEPIYINMHIKVHTIRSQTLTDTEITTISNSVSRFLNKMKIGESVRESDIIGDLYKDQSIVTFVNFVELPFTAFYVPESQAAPIEDIRTGTSINIKSTQYAVLNKIIITQASVG